MRITDFQASKIRSASSKYFGLDSHVWLFGSRMDDRKRGGDIDLYVEPGLQDPVKLVDAKLNFLVEMHRVLGNQRIDVILHRRQSRVVLPIYQVAKETGERLL